MEGLGVDNPAAGKDGSLEGFRQYYETVKQWAARKQFLSRNMQQYPGHRIEQLNALSVVWSNIVFLGCRYGKQLTEKVHEMADGIEIGDSKMRSFKLVPDAMTTKRKSNSEAGEQPQVKKFGPQPRFQPIHFVVSTSVEDQKFKKTEKPKDSMCIEKPLGEVGTPDRNVQESSVLVSTSDHSDNEENSEMELSSTPCIYDPNTSVAQNSNDTDTFMIQTERNYSAKFESHHSDLSKGFRSNVLDMWKDINKQGRKGIGFVKPPKKAGKLVGQNKSVSNPHLGNKIMSLDKSSFIMKLSAIVKQKMLNPAKTSDNQINFTHMLTLSAQACKTNPEYIYVPVKEIPPENLPQCKIPPYGFACEVRCQGVYLATAYSFGKHGARNQAAELSIKLLQNPSMKVVTVKRRFGHVYCDDVVACANDAQLKEFPPALQQNNSPMNEDLFADQQSTESTKAAFSKPWSEFILKENASDAIGVLDNSATFNNMTVEYLYERITNNKWRCSVYVQDHYVADGLGNKAKSKLLAAEKTVSILKALPINLPKVCETQTVTGSNPTNKLQDILVYENNKNPISVLNETAQFNKVTIEYVFENPSANVYQCKIFMAKQFLAEAFGHKSTVKHAAAEAALAILKSTQPVIFNYMWECSDKEAITLNQIRGGDMALKQKIKEDNIGNQLLRKMGWTGGGLGKAGEGITEPITVKEQYKREGLGIIDRDQRITKKDIEKMIKNYITSCNQEDLKFSQELTSEERKYIHMVASRYGLKSHSHGKGQDRFLVVSRKLNKKVLLDQLRQKGQVGRYALVKP